MTDRAQSDAANLTRTGHDHFRAERFEQARTAFDRAIAIAPDDATTHVLLARTLERLDRLEEAIAPLRRAIELAPSLIDAHAGLALVLRRTGQLEDALTVAERAAAIAPEDPNVADVRANLLADLRREDEALAMFDASLRKNPRDARAHVGRARVLLTLGRLSDGFRDYEWRFLMTGHMPQYPVPRWDGSSDPAGRTILIRAEQGLGDTIQMIRYAPLLADRGAKVFVQCQPTLIDLMMSLCGASLVRAIGTPLPRYDLWTPAMSLPHCFGTTIETIPHDTPYLHADPKRVAKFQDVVTKAARAGTLKVGLAWFGQPSQSNNRNRSCPPSALAPLGELADRERSAIALFSLQKAPAPELPPHLAALLTDLSPHLSDMSDTAAAMMHLDLVLTVDTAIAHLAGALALPVWTMLAYAPDWRYLLDRADSPWYPTMRLFRPTKPRGWDDVVENVVRELSSQIA